jgi:hypothetical protein
MNREILDKKDKLYRKSVALRSLALDCKSVKAKEILEKQDDVYKRWKFYSNILKANDKVKDK